VAGHGSHLTGTSQYVTTSQPTAPNKATSTYTHQGGPLLVAIAVAPDQELKPHRATPPYGQR
jgi:hypothetical protein